MICSTPLYASSYVIHESQDVDIVCKNKTFMRDMQGYIEKNDDFHYRYYIRQGRCDEVDSKHKEEANRAKKAATLKAEKERYHERRMHEDLARLNQESIASQESVHTKRFRIRAHTIVCPTLSQISNLNGSTKITFGGVAMASVCMDMPFTSGEAFIHSESGRFALISMAKDGSGAGVWLVKSALEEY